MFPSKTFTAGHPADQLSIFPAAYFRMRRTSFIFALAAQELSITPSAVSHRINLLEKELGFLLFQRFHRRITLTPEGERMQWALDSSFNTLNQEILDIRIAS